MTLSGNSVTRCLSHNPFVGLFGAGYLDQEANKRVIGVSLALPERPLLRFTNKANPTLHNGEVSSVGRS